MRLRVDNYLHVPFTGNAGRRGAAWRRICSDASTEQIARARKLGEEAARQGFSYSKNPFGSGSEEREAWAKGHRSATGRSELGGSDDDTGYTVTRELADKYVREHSTEKLMAQERRSKGGWGVWSVEGQHWVYVE